MLDYDDLSKRALQGKLSPQELEGVARALQSTSTDQSTKEAMIQILDYAGAKSYAPLLEKLLSGPNDWLAAKALETLCVDWRLTVNYLPQISQFIAGVEWDDQDDCRVVAIEVAGDYLTHSHNPELLHQIIRALAEWNPPELEDSARAAYKALVRILELDFDSVPGSTLMEAGSFVVEVAKQRLNQEYELALADYNRAINLDPGALDLYQSRASAYEAMDRYQRAIADYTYFIERVGDMASGTANGKGATIQILLQPYLTKGGILVIVQVILSEEMLN